jgi:tRNA (Thr-GGU) A37 N-methylase
MSYYHYIICFDCETEEVLNKNYPEHFPTEQVQSFLARHNGHRIGIFGENSPERENMLDQRTIRLHEEQRKFEYAEAERKLVLENVKRNEGRY